MVVPKVLTPLLKYRTCAVCRRPTASPWSPYCARCRGHLYDRPENAKRREALVAAYPSMSSHERPPRSAWPS